MNVDDVLHEASERVDRVLTKTVPGESSQDRLALIAWTLDDAVERFIEDGRNRLRAAGDTEAAIAALCDEAKAKYAAARHQLLDEMRAQL